MLKKEKSTNNVSTNRKKLLKLKSKNLKLDR